MYSQSASSLFGLNCIWLAVDFSFYLCAAARCRLLARSPSPTPSPVCPSLSLSLIAWRAAFCLYFSVCQLLATKLNTCLCFLWPTHWLKLARGAEERASSVWAWTCAHVCMYNLAINRVPFQPDS